MLSLRLFGGMSLSNPGGTIPARANQRRRLALLAILAATPGKPATRDRLAALLWPDADSDRARHLLSDSLYVLRSSLGDDLLRVDGENVSINRDFVRIDVAEFLDAMQKRDYLRAVDARQGAKGFLDGVHLHDSPEFERWVDGVRTELDGAYHLALRELAQSCTSAGDFDGAVAWWRRLAAEDPLSASVAAGLIRALNAAGDKAAALAYARVYESLVRSELDTQPDPSVIALVEAIRNGVSQRPLATPTPPAGPAVDGNPAPRPSREITSVTARVFAHSVLHTPARAGLEGKRRGRRVIYSTTFAVLVSVAFLAIWRGQTRPDRGVVNAVRSPHVDYRLRYRTKNPMAYAYYLRGRQHRELRDDPGFSAAVADYRSAIVLDSTYAEAWAGLSEVYSLLRVVAKFEKYPPRETALLAESAALKAVELADSLGEAHMALGLVRLGGRLNLAEAGRELQLARSLDPSDPRTREYLVALYCWTDRPEQGLREARAAVAADELSMGALRELGRALMANHRYEEALVHNERLRTVSPVIPVKMAPVMSAETYDIEGLYSNALREIAAAAGDYARALRGYTLARMGNRLAADSALRELLARRQRGQSGAFEIAVVYTGMRDFDKAFEWLDKSFDDITTRGEIMDPLFDDLRADPRFYRVRQKMGIPVTGMSRASERQVAALGPR